MRITDNLVQLAKDEGEKTALRKCEELLEALEELMEISDRDEHPHAFRLHYKVKTAMELIPGTDKREEEKEREHEDRMKYWQRKGQVDLR